ncbi:prephenate dehydrogenase [Cloacibacillus sp. An23]|uniref:prephenate dehydrogenase n=1 Tax=Cloacibacillus sp. An23 TaxID=1965591 RepID=UPI000B37CAE2|nr:prephenate dehydrogenase [Cloacibacillus sp. An23]OUO92273.1 prephenate dehydrogenase [Cloacibacillus sp. An23]
MPGKERLTVGITGLGLIGGSFARAYAAGGARVLGCDADADTMKAAAEAGAISGVLTPEKARECDLLLIALYPAAAVRYLTETAPYLSGCGLVMDCCGVKRDVCRAGFALAGEHGFDFLGGHPMAGIQFSGFANSRADMFRGASMIIVPPEGGDYRLTEKAERLLAPAGFGRFTITTAEHHDEMIAFTSQMCHVVSNAYVKSPRAQEHAGYSAGSYADLTRVAKLNPSMWTELFIDNRDFLMNEIDLMIKHLSEYREALEASDGRRLASLLAKGVECEERAGR